jgi:hypothetical protein
MLRRRRHYKHLPPRIEHEHICRSSEDECWINHRCCKNDLPRSTEALRLPEGEPPIALLHAKLFWCLYAGSSILCLIEA